MPGRCLRRFALVLALALAAPVAVAAPVLPGELSVHSGVGAPLAVSIDLGAPPEADLLGLSVELASRREYAERGLAWDDVLSTLQTGLRLKRDGRLSFTVASARPLPVQTLNLLVRIAQRDEVPVIRLYVLAAADASRPTDRVRVAPGETALGIAERITPRGATRYQSLAALYQQNRDAFDGSPHRLRAGTDLIVPDEVAILAQREIEGQRLASVPLVRGTGPSPSAGRVAGTPEVASTGGDALRLSRTSPSDRKRGNALTRQETRVAIENVTAEARSRIAELEAIERDLKKLLAARAAQIATLQRELEIMPAGESAQAAQAAAAKAAAATTPTAPPASEPARTTMAQPSAPAAAATMTPAAPAPPTVRPTPLPPPAPPPPDWTETVLESLPIVIAAGVLLIAVIAWLVKRRRGSPGRRKRRRGKRSAVGESTVAAPTTTARDTLRSPTPRGDRFGRTTRF